MGAVCRMLGALEAHARKEERTGMRGSTLGMLQTRPIDGLIQTEGSVIQGAAVGITQAITFSAAFSQFNASVMQISGAMDGFGLNTVLGLGFSAFAVINAVGSLIGSLRYKAINWQAQVDYYTEKLPVLKRRLFGYLRPERQRELSREGVNPVVQWLAELHAKARALGEYYGCDVDGGAGWQMVEAALNNLAFEASRSGTMTGASSQKLVRSLDFLLVGDAQAQPYVQEELARLKAAARSAHEGLPDVRNLPPEASAAANRLMKGLLEWEELLAGVLKQPLSEEFARWRKTATFKVAGRAKATVQTIAMLNELTKFSDAFGPRSAHRAAGVSLERELADLQAMAIAVSETHKANLLIAAGVTSITSSTLGASLTIAEILTESTEVLDLLQPVSGTLVGVPAIIAVAFTARQEYFNQGVRKSVASKLKGASLSPAERAALGKVLRLCHAQSVLSAGRMSASVLVAAGAVITAATAGTGASVGGAVSGVGAGVGAAAIAASLYVRFGQAYRLPPDLPAMLVGVYRPEIQSMYEELVRDDPSPAEQRAAWATVADTFLRARHFEQTIGRERTAAIRQIIEGGMEATPDALDELESLKMLLPVGELSVGGCYELPVAVVNVEELQVGQEVLYLSGGSTPSALRARFQGFWGGKAHFASAASDAKLPSMKPDALATHVLDPAELEPCTLLAAPSEAPAPGARLAFMAPNGAQRRMRVLARGAVLGRRPDEFLASRLLRVAHLQPGMAYQLPLPVTAAAALVKGDEYLHVGGDGVSRCRYTGPEAGRRHSFTNIATGACLSVGPDEVADGDVLFDGRRVETARLVGEPDLERRTATFEAVEGGSQRTVVFVNERTLLADAVDTVLAPRLARVAALQVGGLYRVPARVSDPITLERGQVVLHVEHGVARRCEVLRRLRDDSVHLRPLVAGYDIMISPGALAAAPVLLDMGRTVKARLAKLPDRSAAVAVFASLGSSEGSGSATQLQVPIVDGGRLVAERLEDIPEPDLLGLADLEAGARYFVPAHIRSATQLALGQTVFCAAGGAVSTCRFIGGSDGQTTLEDLSHPGTEISLTDADIERVGLLYDPDDIAVCTLAARPAPPAAGGVPFRVESSDTQRLAPCIGGGVVASKAESAGSGAVTPAARWDVGEEDGYFKSQMDDLINSLRDLDEHSEDLPDAPKTLGSQEASLFPLTTTPHTATEPATNTRKVVAVCWAHSQGPTSSAQDQLPSAALPLAPIKSDPMPNRRKMVGVTWAHRSHTQ